MLGFFSIIGAAGLLLITVGVLDHTRKTQNVLYILGGGLLLGYSISIHDMIFIILQIIFILAAGYDEIKTYESRRARKR
jgi:predicted membrane protein